MDTILYLGLGNAALAATLALLAALITRLCRRPTLAHALWLLVLLRLLAPPLLPVALPRPHWLEPAPAPVEKELEQAALPQVSVSNEVEAPGPVIHATNPAPVPETEEEPALTPAFSLSWQTVVLSVWLLGSLAWWLMVARRLYRFQRLLRHAAPAPPLLQEQARHLAGRLGLRRCPGVYLVPAPVSPMLLALGLRPRLLLPAALWGRLSPAQQDALLAHELAHLRRGDPWVRRLELVVLGLYWWLPVVWWARNALEEAEEQCCDAWVVWALPGSGPDYAAALVETLTFLSPDPSPVPLGASGAGRVPLLKRRLTMILRGDSPRALSRRAFWALVAVAALLLSLAPRGARTETPPAEPAPVREEPAPILLPPHPAAGATQVHPTLAQHKVLTRNEMLCASCHEVPHPKAGKTERTDDWRKAHDEVVRLLTEVQRTQAELRKAEANLNRILERSSEHGGGKAKQDVSSESSVWPNGLVLKTTENVEKGIGPITSAVFLMKNTSDEVIQISHFRSSSGALTVTPTSLRLEPGQTRRVVARVDTSQFSGTKTITLFVTFERPRRGVVQLYLRAKGRGTEKATPPTADAQKDKLERLERLEKGLDNLMHEVESLRRELRPSTPPPSKEDEVRKRAEKDFAVAEYYHRAGALDSAVMFYEKVRRHFPASPLAEKASACIKEIQSKEKALPQSP